MTGKTLYTLLELVIGEDCGSDNADKFHEALLLWTHDREAFFDLYPRAKKAADIFNKLEALETPMKAEPQTEPQLYCVRVLANEDCWIAEWEGDPGRTLIQPQAKVFESKDAAERHCVKLNKMYPNRSFWVEAY